MVASIVRSLLDIEKKFNTHIKAQSSVDNGDKCFCDDMNR